MYDKWSDSYIMKKITLLILLLNIFLLKGCGNDTDSDNSDLLDDLISEEVLSLDDLTISLSNDSLPPADNADILSYEVAALIGSNMVFDLFGVDFENKHIVMHYTPIESIWNSSQGAYYEYDEWFGVVWEKDKYSLYLSDYFRLNLTYREQLLSLIEFRINVESGAITVINKPNQLIYVVLQYSDIIRNLMKYGFENPLPAEVDRAKERAEHYFSVLTDDMPLTLLYDPISIPFVPLPIPFFQFIFTCADGKYYAINLHYETHQLVAISSRIPFDRDLISNDNTGDSYVETEEVCEDDCVIFGDFIQELNLSFGMTIHQVIDLLGNPDDEESFEFDGVEIESMSWDNLNSTDLFPYRIRIRFEDG